MKEVAVNSQDETHNEDIVNVRPSNLHTNEQKGKTKIF